MRIGKYFLRLFTCFGLDMTIKEKEEKQVLGANVETFPLELFVIKF